MTAIFFTRTEQDMAPLRDSIFGFKTRSEPLAGGPKPSAQQHREKAEGVCCGCSLQSLYKDHRFVCLRTLYVCKYSYPSI